MLARRMVSVTAFYFCYGWTLWLYLGWIPSFSLHGYRLNLKSSALFSAGVFLAGVLGNTLGGVVSDRIFDRTGDRKKARRNLVVAGFVFSVASMLPILLLHNLTWWPFFLTSRSSRSSRWGPCGLSRWTSHRGFPVQRAA